MAEDLGAKLKEIELDLADEKQDWNTWHYLSAADASRKLEGKAKEFDKDDDLKDEHYKKAADAYMEKMGGGALAYWGNAPLKEDGQIDEKKKSKLLKYFSGTTAAKVKENFLQKGTDLETFNGMANEDRKLCIGDSEEVLLDPILSASNDKFYEYINFPGSVNGKMLQKSILENNPQAKIAAVKLRNRYKDSIIPQEEIKMFYK